MSRERGLRYRRRSRYRSGRLPGWWWILLLCLGSGACASIEGVIWTRWLKLVLGNTVSVFSLLASVALGGLALGALLMGRYADCLSKPLRWFARVEVCLAAIAASMPWAMRAADGVYRWLFQKMDPSSAWLLGIQMVLSLALLLVPTLLMGCVLPLLGRQVTTAEERVGHRVGQLYAMGLLGATAGCFLTGFLLIRKMGVSGTLHLAAAINLLVACGGWIGSRRYERSRSQFIETASPTALSPAVVAEGEVAGIRVQSHWLMAAFLGSGLVSMGLGVLWVRSVELALGDFANVWAAALGTVLFGQALGSWMGSALAKRLSNTALAFGVALFWLGFWGFLSGFWFKAWFTQVMESFVPLLNSLVTNADMRQEVWPIFHSVFLFLGPAMLIGAGFPLALQAWSQLRHSAGRTIGSVGGAHLLGAMLGGLVAVFILVPLVGLQRASSLSGLVAVGLGAGLIWTFLSPSQKIIRQGSLAVAVAGAVVVVVWSASFPQQPLVLRPPGELIAMREGPSATVAVARQDDGRLVMSVNKLPVGGDGIHRSAPATLGHLGVLLHPNPQEALIFGFGTGETTACLARHGLRRVDCVEASPEMVEVALKCFPHINLGDRLTQQARMVYLDGRNYLSLTDRRYDLILNKSQAPSTSDDAPFFTREHFLNARLHLNPGGLFIAPLALEGYPQSHLDSVLGTFLDTFPHVTIWFPVTKPFVYAYLVGSREPQTFSPRHIDEVLQRPAVKESLDYLGLHRSGEVLSGCLGDQADARNYLKSYTVNSDNRPFVEFDMALRKLQLGDYFPSLIAAMLSGSVLNHLDWTGYGESQKAAWLTEFESYNKAAKYVLKAHAEPAYFARLLACDFGLKVLPDFAPLLEQQDACLRDLEVALRDAVMAPERVIADMVFQLQNNPDFAMAWLVRALALQQQNKLNDALAAAQAALQYAPASAVAHERLGLIHQQLRDYPRAVAELDKAVQLKPAQERLRLRLAEAHHLAGERAEALRQIQESLRINPHYPPAQQRLAEWSTAGGKKE